MLMIDEQALQQLRSEKASSQLERIVRRDRNHPSVILWSLGNEEPHQATERGARINAELKAHVQRLDPTRPTTFAMDQGWDSGVGRVVDVLGFNYRTNQIEAYHQRHPEQPVYGSETGSTVATRGEYANDPARHIVRAYDTEHPWWATTAEEWWTIVADRPYIAGGFVWTGFDYRGEPTPYRHVAEHQLAVRDPRHLRLPQGQLLLLPRVVAARPAAGASAAALELAGTRGPADRGLGARQYRRGRAAGSTAARSAASRCRATAISNGACLMRPGGWRRSGTMEVASSRAMFARRSGPAHAVRLTADRRLAKAVRW